MFDDGVHGHPRAPVELGGDVAQDAVACLPITTGRGLPRGVNNLALQALIAAYAANKTIVDEASARLAINGIPATD